MTKSSPEIDKSCFPQDQVLWTDPQGGKWDLSLDLYTLRKVDASDYSELTDVKVSLLKMDHRTVTELITNEPFLYAVIYTVLHDQLRKSLGLNNGNPREAEEELQQHFAKLVNAKSKKSLQETWWRAYTDFFPERESLVSTLRRQIEELKELEQSGMREQLDRMGSHWQQWMRERAEAMIKEQMGDPWMGTPG